MRTWVIWLALGAAIGGATMTVACDDTDGDGDADGDADGDGDVDGDGDGDTYSCDTIASTGYCQEYVGLTTSDLVTPYQDACTGISGAWAAAACSRVDSLGGCQAPEAMGITITNWFFLFAGSYQTAAEVEAGCAAPSTYIAP